MRKVEILKIGLLGRFAPTIIRRNLMRPETILMVVSDGGPVYDYYIDILRKSCGDDYKYLKTEKLIGAVSHPKSVQKFDSEPEVGKAFTINNGAWQTSTVTRIVSDSIFITKNSVYAIHEVDKLRHQKLNDLGI
jgi:hypothetical protein